MQDAGAPFQPDGSSTYTTGVGNTTGKEGFSTRGTLNKEVPPAAKNKAMRDDTNMEAEHDYVGEREQQELTAQELDHSKQNTSLEVGENTVDRNDGQFKRAKKDDGKLAGTGKIGQLGHGVQMEEFMEEPSIQEDDLLQTVCEVLEARRLNDTRPIPVLVKGKEVDLLKLCVQVRACGGYDKVTMWSSISKSLGFGQECGALLKLVYVKYLKGLENRRLVANHGAQSPRSALKGEIADTTVKSVKSEFVRSESKCRGTASSKKKSNEEVPVVEDAVVESISSVVAEGSDMLADVIEWVKRLALNPGDPKKGQGVRVSRWSEAWVRKCEMLVSRVRVVLWKHECTLPLHDSSPSETRTHHQKKRGRAEVHQGKGVKDKKSRHSSS